LIIYNVQVGLVSCNFSTFQHIEFGFYNASMMVLDYGAGTKMSEIAFFIEHMGCIELKKIDCNIKL